MLRQKKHGYSGDKKSGYSYDDVREPHEPRYGGRSSLVNELSVKTCCFQGTGGVGMIRDDSDSSPSKRSSDTPRDDIAIPLRARGKSERRDSPVIARL
jgi:hypothetical protein